MNADSVKALLDKRTADLQRLVSIGKKMQAGKRISAGDTAWVLDVQAIEGGAASFTTDPVSRMVICEVLSVTSRTLLSMSKEGLPKAGRNQYRVPEVVAWYVDRQVRKLSAKISGKNGATAADLKSKFVDELRRERLREARRKNDMEEGKLIPVAEVATWSIDVAAMLRAEFEAIGRAHGPEVNRDLQEAVDRFVAAREERFEGEGPA